MRWLLSASRADLIGAALVVACGVFLVVQSPAYELRKGAVIGPGFVPFWFGVAMIVFGLAAAVGAAMRVRRAALAAGEPDDAESASGSASGSGSGQATRSRRRLALVFALVIVAVALVPVLGTLVAFGLLIFVLLAAVERERWWLSLLISVVVMGALYELFARFLQIPLPTGLWGF